MEAVVAKLHSEYQISITANLNSSVPLQRYLLEFQTQNPDFLTKFFEWVSRLADKDLNWKFWK